MLLVCYIRASNISYISIFIRNVLFWNAIGAQVSPASKTQLIGYGDNEHFGLYQARVFEIIVAGECQTNEMNRQTQ